MPNSEKAVTSFRAETWKLEDIEILKNKLGMSKGEIHRAALDLFLSMDPRVTSGTRLRVGLNSCEKVGEKVVENLQYQSNFTQIEVIFNKITSFLAEKPPKKCNNLMFSNSINDIQELLLDINQLDNELYLKCVKILKQNTHKSIYGRIMANHEQTELSTL